MLWGFWSEQDRAIVELLANPIVKDRRDEAIAVESDLNSAIVSSIGGSKNCNFYPAIAPFESTIVPRRTAPGDRLRGDRKSSPQRGLAIKKQPHSLGLESGCLCEGNPWGDRD
ncbi:hypothetical protein JJD41_23825 [Oxynema sp. CENA135]|uniref:hypothetical protein n=1 Tax=Oxynema sp. CENA135 TaxID=984206 RepID=UPI00190CD604|nr:hypothetical protein [Oxynema sp. CENA135]MBK4732874.1 hypothetical protein [Oxynema sp. CENA135]